MNHKEKALDYFNRKFHCSQVVLAAWKDVKRIEANRNKILVYM